MYLGGIVVPKNSSKAWELILSASSQGDSLALLMYGDLLYCQENYLAAEVMLEKAIEAGSPNAQSLLEKVREEISKVGMYFLVKVSDMRWADKFLDGDIFMRYLGGFGIYGTHAYFNRSKDNSNVANNYRGDSSEGLTSTLGDSQKEKWFDGMYDMLLQRNKIFCLYSLDVNAEHNLIAPIDPRIQDFGDTAVIILDVNEFLRRVNKAFSDRFGTSFWAGYKRVSYELDYSKKRSYTEFDKDVSYSWQREFRISLDLSNGRVPQSVLDDVSDYDALQYVRNHIKLGLSELDNAKKKLYEEHKFREMIDVDINPDSIADSLVVNIGDIRDICIAVPTSDFISGVDKLIDEKYLPPPKVDTVYPPRAPYPTFFRAMMKKLPWETEVQTD
jgi:hypothetical protein